MAKWLVLVALALSAAACDTNTPFKATVGTVPTPTTAASISPSTLARTTLIAPGCPVLAAFAGDIQLLISSASGDAVNVNRVSFRLLDGSTVGGPTMTFATQDLTRMFGSTLVAGGTRRVFPFRPTFGCGILDPHSLLVDLLLADQFGVTRQTTLTATIK